MRNYRGQRIDNGEWVYGYLLLIDGETCIAETEIKYEFGLSVEDCILEPSPREVHPETVGQSTGLKDKNGVEIYEGDVCRNGDWEPDANAYNYREEEVRYYPNEGAFHGWNYNVDGMTCEIIGNIHKEQENE